MRSVKPAASYLAVARAGDTVYVRGHGACEATLCPALRDFAADMQEDGYRFFVIDLHEVTGMDSTFMGVLLGIHRIQTDTSDGGAVIVANASSHCRKQMGMLGLTRLLDVRSEAVEFPHFETTMLEDREVSERERIRLIKEAHERLIEVDERNEVKFGALLSALNRELQE